MYSEFRENYERARECLADYYVSECVDIADTPKIGVKVVDKPTGLEVTRADMLEHRRLQVATRQWAAGKLSPRKYGDRQTVKHEGSIGGAGAPAVDLTPDQSERIAREMLIQRGYEFD